MEVAVEIKAKKRRKRRKWRLDDSTIWAPRRLRGNSRDYYETDGALKTVFDSDWQIASIGCAKLLKMDPDDPNLATCPAAQALWKHGRTIYGVRMTRAKREAPSHKNAGPMLTRMVLSRAMPGI